MRMSRRSLCAAVIAAVVGPGAHAAPLPDAAQVIDYAVVDQDLGGVLGGLAEQIGVRAEISPKLHARVHGRLEPAPAEQMLDRLAAIYGFDWYYSGRTLYVSARDEAMAKVLPLAPISATELSRTLGVLGIADARWPLRVSDRGDLALVAGPPRFAALVDQTLAALKQRETAAPDPVHVFRGSSAR
jgi:type III secretion protein C